MNETLKRIIDSPDDFLFTAKYLRETLKDIEIKPNSQITASMILSKCLEIYDGDMINEIAGIISEYAEAYHVKKSAERWTPISAGTPSDGEYIVMVENDRDEVFTTCSFCEDGNFDDIRSDIKVLKYQELPEVIK